MRIISFILIFLIIFSSSCLAISLLDGQKEYLGGNYQEAIRDAKRLPDTDEKLYFIGLCYTKLGRYTVAREYFRKVIKRFRGSDLYTLTMIKLADTYFLEKKLDQAKQLYSEIKKRYPKSDHMPIILLRLAQISSRQGDWSDKAKYIRELKSKYPQSSEMRFVEILESYGDFFTIQVGAFSSKSNAYALREELKDSNYKNAYIKEDRKGDFPIYKVRVGKYKKRYDAQTISSKLSEDGYPARIYP